MRERVAAACAQPGAKVYEVAARFSASTRQASGPERERLAALAGIVLQLFDLRLATLEQPAVAATMWSAIYQRISTSVTRIETLRSLAQWEDSAATAAARQYQQSIEEEIYLILQAFSTEIQTALQGVNSN